VQLKLAIVNTSSAGETVNLSTVAGNLGGSYSYSMISAQSGSDTVTGTAALDTFIGGQGDDRLSGSAGADRLTGDTGVDTFVFNSALGGGNVDLITDFNASENTQNQDWIELSSLVFENAGATGGVLNAADFLNVNGIANVTSTNTANIIYDSATGALYYDANAGLADDAMQFATVQFSSNTAGDFGAADIKVS
jgi:Ca2+-binding RTX toxin-like protein